MVMLFNLRLGQSVARARAHANAPPLKEESRKSTASTNRSPGLATKFGTDMSRTKEKSMALKSVAAKTECLFVTILSADAIRATPTK